MIGSTESHDIVQLRRRGVWPEGMGEVFFSCPVVKTMRPLQLIEEGKVRRVRGMAYPNHRANILSSLQRFK